MKAAWMLLCALVALAATATIAADASAQCMEWQAMPFSSLSGPNGADGYVEALTIWDPDGPGGVGPKLIAAGEFSHMQGVAVANIAARDYETGAWQPLGSGTNDQIRALAVFNGELIAAGLFTQAGGQAASHVARWNGTNWQPLGSGTNDQVRALAVFNGQLIAGGYFTSAGGNVASHVARWNGTSWQALGSGANDWVECLGIYGGELVAGGFFTMAGGVGANHVARWNGGAWLAMGTGTNAEVLSVGVVPGGLAVGGRFTTASGLAANRIALWDGSWHTLGTGMDNAVLAVGSYQNQFIAGGAFLTAGGQTVAGIARWTGSAWVSLDTGVIGSVDTIYPWGAYLVVGGSFFDAGAHAVNNIGTWDGLEWGSFGGGGANSVNVLATYGTRVVAGGDFHQSTPLDPSGHFIVGWNGDQLVPFGTGMNAPVLALCSFTYTIGQTRELVAGGGFTRAGGVVASGVARWQEGFGAPQGWQAMGAGFNGVVRAIERFNSQTYAGGAFTLSGVIATNHMARWNETSGQWESVRFGVDGTVLALKSYGGYLYAGGVFTSASGVSTGGLARYDGANWSAVGGVFDGIVHSLEVHDGLLVIGGDFQAPGPGGASYNLVKWDGAAFSNFGIGGADGIVRALRSKGSRLYIGGDFTVINGNTAKHIAWWDGGASIFELDGGTNSSVTCLASFHDEIHAGGAFAFVQNGALEARCWARFDETGIPWFVQNPATQTVANGGTAVFSATVAAGGASPSYQWYRYNFPVQDGPALGGSTISGAHTDQLTIANVGPADAAKYSLVAQNACGADTSLVASLNPANIGVGAPGAFATGLGLPEPNPARGPTRIGFSLGHAARARLVVFDLAGRRVSDLDLGLLPAGSHHHTWNARDDAGREVRPGLYFVRLDVDGRSSQVRRLTMLR